MEKQTELLFKIARKSLEDQGIEILVCENGEAKTRVTLKKEQFNFMGIVYGGILYHLADVTAGVAFCSTGSIGPTVSGDMQFLRAAAEIKELFCEASVVKAGKTISFVKTEVKGSDGTLFATGTFLYTGKK